MAKLPARRDRFYLRDLHQEIALYDRKLAYLDNFGVFATPAERAEAEKGLRTKRAPLERAALELVASGVEYDEKDVPQSLRAMHPVHESAPKNLTLVERA